MVPVGGLAQTSKRLIKVAGRDATKFLNGLVTSRFLPDIKKKKQHTISAVDDAHADLALVVDIHTNWGLMHEDIYDPMNHITISRDGINLMFLTSKGRVVTDLFIYVLPFAGNELVLSQHPEYLVEVDEAMVKRLMLLLKLHKLGAKVTIEETPYLSYYYYHDSFEFDQWLDQVQDAYFTSTTPAEGLQNANSFIKSELFSTKAQSLITGFAFDNRIPNFGVKIVTTEPVDEVFSSENFLFEQTKVDEIDVTRRRYVNGLFEVGDAPVGTTLLPFETNLDYMNGLSLEKGCYVGQELTIRTYNNGIIRKRVVPIQFHPANEELEGTLEAPELEIGGAVLDFAATIPAESDVIAAVEEPESAPATPVAASPFGTSLKPVRKRKSLNGKVLSTRDNLGFALMNLNDLEKTHEYKVDVDGTTMGATAFIPQWWPQEEP